MKIYLVGYPGGQNIVPISRSLLKKYAPQFEPIFLVNDRRVDQWGSFVADSLKGVEGPILFGLDDYLLNGPVDMEAFKTALEISKDVPCIKVGPGTPEEHEGYPITTQYSLWNKDVLIEILEQITNPWDFEMKGGRLFSEKYTSLHIPCFSYPKNSALSARWKGIKLEGNERDVEELKANGLL